MTRPLAIVTGASTGIGFELAHVAAEAGHDLIVVADEPLIVEAARDFATHGVDAVPVEADLSTRDGVDAVIAATGGRAIAVLCANAGTGRGGLWVDQPVEEWRRIVDTNIFGTLYIVQESLRRMIAAGSGRVLMTGSIVGFIPGTYNSIYNATKAFIDNFSEALVAELRGVEGVTVTNLLPGATQTEFFARADMLDTAIGRAPKGDPAKVARDGWDAMMAGRAHIVSGLSNKLQVAAARVAPPALMAEAHRLIAKPDGS